MLEINLCFIVFLISSGRQCHLRLPVYWLLPHTSTRIWEDPLWTANLLNEHFSLNPSLLCRPCLSVVATSVTLQFDHDWIMSLCVARMPLVLFPWLLCLLTAAADWCWSLLEGIGISDYWRSMKGYKCLMENRQIIACVSGNYRVLTSGSCLHSQSVSRCQTVDVMVKCSNFSGSEAMVIHISHSSHVFEYVIF